ncbi:hypothetical protein T10_6951 [Trichinella papuae]|uniref:Uncharacterized protein n=1 Tax=Trichinella papuae TaxID=268474 RepID=A0A0V1MEX1_9BILA|nr:hypothetical protein T10_6951 [Trichinella papuae]
MLTFVLRCAMKSDGLPVKRWFPKWQCNKSQTTKDSILRRLVHLEKSDTKHTFIYNVRQKTHAAHCSVGKALPLNFAIFTQSCACMKSSTVYYRTGIGKLFVPSTPYGFPRRLIDPLWVSFTLFTLTDSRSDAFHLYV